MGDILEILPFEDPLVVIEIDGDTLWETLEVSLATWPAQEGWVPHTRCNCDTVVMLTTNMQAFPRNLRLPCRMGLT